MSKLDSEHAYPLGPDEMSREKLALIHRYTYNESMTRCVAYLESIEKYAKLILGERG